MDCIFCKIVAGELPCTKIAESENFLAFLDIAPISEGHTLVVPKHHATNFLDFSSELGKEFLKFSQQVSKTVVAGVQADGFNFGINNGEAAGQAVFHTHFHIIPRWNSDTLENWGGKQVSSGQLQEIQQNILQ